MNKEALSNIIEYISSSQDIQLSDIPCIDLYMDQVTTLFDDKLANTKREVSDKILTKTMINNYTKAKTLLPPKNKKYSKNHIILLSLIYSLKQILSINDIKTLLTPLLNSMTAVKENAGVNLDELYSAYLNIKKEDLDNFAEGFDDMFNHVLEKSSELRIDDNDRTILILLVLTLVNQAAFNKRLAEKIIDGFLTSSN
ncbi:MAG: DUF1836 domain-containing protein [Lutispora sp.]|nr:DUF1836 domain-containing protein [Lutispora sp.]